MITFNADEIFEIAEQIERNGAKFYRLAARGAPPKAAAMFQKLAEMEVQHEKTFHDMRARFSAADRQTQTFDPDDQAAQYLRIFAEGKVFDPQADAAAKLTGKESIQDILRTAIGLEKDSIVFYLGVKGMVPRSLGADKIDRIIEEEMSHIALLSSELTAG